MHIEFCTKLNFLEGEYAITQNIGFCYHESVTHAGMSSYGRVKYVGFYGGPPCAAAKLRHVYYEKNQLKPRKTYIARYINTHLIGPRTYV